MSIWTCSRTSGAAALVAALIALGSGAPAPAVPRLDDGPPPLAQKLAVLGDSVVIAAPSGYCIDSLGSIETDLQAFVLMAACGAVPSSRRAARNGQTPGLLTASVDGAAGGLPSVAEIDAYVGSAEGRAALARSGDPAALRVGRSYARDGVFFVYLLDSSEDPVLAGHSWRAVFPVNGRLVTATLRDFVDDPISPAAGFRTVEQFVSRIVSASTPIR